MKKCNKDGKSGVVITCLLPDLDQIRAVFDYLRGCCRDQPGITSDRESIESKTEKGAVNSMGATEAACKTSAPRTV